MIEIDKFKVLQRRSSIKIV